MRRSKTLVFSASKDFQWRRHLYMVKAAIGFPAQYPRFFPTQSISASTFSYIKVSIRWPCLHKKFKHKILVTYKLPVSIRFPQFWITIPIFLNSRWCTLRFLKSYNVSHEIMSTNGSSRGKRLTNGKFQTFCSSTSW